MYTLSKNLITGTAIVVQPGWLPAEVPAEATEEGLIRGLALMWETRMKALAPVFRLDQAWLFALFGE